eukprot:4951468-Pyramimonas_sp.AAC.1
MILTVIFSTTEHAADPHDRTTPLETEDALLSAPAPTHAQLPILLAPREAEGDLHEEVPAAGQARLRGRVVVDLPLEDAGHRRELVRLQRAAAN